MLFAFPMGRDSTRLVALCALLIAACGSESNNPPLGGGGQAAPVTGGNSAGASAGGGHSGSIAAPNATSGSGGSTATVTAGATAGAGGTGTSTATAGSAGAADSAGAGGATAPHPMGSADWTLMGYDAASTFYNRDETVLTKANAASLELLWEKDMGGPVYSAALQIQGKLYVATPSSVRAYDAMTGMELWTAMASSTSSISYMDGTIYLNTRGAEIVAINAADGNKLWTKPINTASQADGSSSVLPIGDMLIVGGSNGGIELLGGSFRGFLSGLDRATGAIKWTTYTVPTGGAKGASIWSSPSGDLAAGVVYGSTGNNYGAPATDTSDAFIAFDMATGDIKWKSQRVMNDTFGGGLGGVGPDADFGANPVLYETMIGGVMTKVIGAGNKGGQAHAVRADNGMELWKRELCPGTADGSKGVFVNSSWSGKYLIMGCNATTNATLYGLDGATGEIGWMRQISGPVWGRIAIANGVGVTPAGAGIEVFDTDTGAMIKKFASKGGTVASTITISNGRVAWGEGMNWTPAVRGQWLHVLAVK